MGECARGQIIALTWQRADAIANRVAQRRFDLDGNRPMLINDRPISRGETSFLRRNDKLLYSALAMLRNEHRRVAVRKEAPRENFERNEIGAM